MRQRPDTFLIDANVLITPFQKYYPFDWAPGFWQCMEDAILSRDVVLLDVVKKEILKGQAKPEKKDDLTKWIEEFSDRDVLSRKSEEIINMYSEVLKYVQTCGLYKANALKEWASPSVADAWLIASACTGGHIIITFETPNSGLSKNSPSKKAKIPDVGKHFSVECKDLFYMMRRLGFKL